MKNRAQDNIHTYYVQDFHCYYRDVNIKYSGKEIEMKKENKEIKFNKANMSVQEAAKELGVDVQTVRTLL